MQACGLLLKLKIPLDVFFVWTMQCIQETRVSSRSSSGTRRLGTRSQIATDILSARGSELSGRLRGFVGETALWSVTAFVPLLLFLVLVNVPFTRDNASAFFGSGSSRLPAVYNSDHPDYPNLAVLPYSPGSAKDYFMDPWENTVPFWRSPYLWYR